MESSSRRVGRTRYRITAALGVSALLAVAACSKSTNTGTPPTTPQATTPAATSPAAPTTPPATVSPGAGAAPTVDTASVSGLGTVLVNGSGQTLYVLSSESGKKVTCTTANSCTPVWPPMTVPGGATGGVAAGSAESSLLGTATGSDGTVRVTYAGYPLYSFADDGGPKSDKGEDISSFGGIWYAMAPNGTPVTAKTARPSPTPSPTAASGGGYGY